MDANSLPVGYIVYHRIHMEYEHIIYIYYVHYCVVLFLLSTETLR